MKLWMISKRRLYSLLKLTELDLKLTEILVALYKRLLDSRSKPKLVLTTIINNSKFIIMDYSMDANQMVLVDPQLLDADSLQPVSAQFSNLSVAGGGTAVKGEVLNNQFKFSGVAEGVDTFTVTATGTYTDKNTNQPVTSDFSLTVVITSKKVITAEKVVFNLVFGTPQLQ